MKCYKNSIFKKLLLKASPNIDASGKYIVNMFVLNKVQGKTANVDKAVYCEDVHQTCLGVECNNQKWKKVYA